MPINGVFALKLAEVQKSQPKGKALVEAVAANYKSLEKELKADYPCKEEAKKMSYGSSGQAYGA